MTMEDEETQLSALLPRHAAEELRAASRVLGSFERLKAIDSTTDRLRASYPWFFKEDGDDQDRRQ